MTGTAVSAVNVRTFDAVSIPFETSLRKSDTVVDSAQTQTAHSIIAVRKISVFGTIMG